MEKIADLMELKKFSDTGRGFLNVGYKSKLKGWPDTDDVWRTSR